MRTVLATLFALLALLHGASQAAMTSRQGVGTVSRGSAAYPVATNPTGADLQTLLSTRSYVPHPTTGMPTIIRDLIDRPFVPQGSGQIAVTASRAVTAAAAAKAIARAVPGVAAIGLGLELLEMIRCRQSSAQAYPECDDGQPEQLVGVYCTHGEPGFPDAGRVCAPTSMMALHRMIDWKNAHLPSGAASFALSGVTSGAGGTHHYFIKVCHTGNPGCTAPSYSNSLQTTSATGMACPPIVVNGVEIYPTKGYDDKCPTGVYEPKTTGEVEDAVMREPESRDKLPGLLPGLDAGGIGYETGDPTASGPRSAPGSRDSTSTAPDGTISVRDIDYGYEYPTATGGPLYRWWEVVRETTYPPGTTPPPYTAPTDPESPPPAGPGTPPPGGTVTVIERTPVTLEVETCGLPGKPPCKIDESGTPSGVGASTAAAGELTAAMDGLAGEISGAGSKVGTGWLWGLELPAGVCTVLNWELPPFGTPFVVDFCGSPWISFMRSVFAWLWGVLAALYVWRTATNANGGL